MTERDARRLERVRVATGDVEWAWRGELNKWRHENDKNLANVLKVNLSTRILPSVPWVEHHPIDLALEANEFLKRKHGISPGRQLTLFPFCQD